MNISSYTESQIKKVLQRNCVSGFKLKNAVHLLTDVFFYRLGLSQQKLVSIYE